MFDESQQRAIEAWGGHHLVLAAPGCGKTAILTERVVRAKEKGVDFAEMLCLTFTNRASREMRNRITQRVGEPCQELFVGNIHRFCSGLLFQSNLLAANTAIIDEEDQGDILTYIDDHFFLGSDGQVIRSKVRQIVDLEKYIIQRQLQHPKEVLKDLTRSDDVYATDYEECYQRASAVGFRVERIEDSDFWRHLRYALLYHQYKKEHMMIDFSDLLVLGYEALRQGAGRKYRWIQVDEVQDLNHLQHAIIDALTNPEEHTVMYLGDEQQAIYSFLGAKQECLRQLQQRCEGHVMTLGHNYRSPRYLLDVYNTYAREVLHFPSELLPVASKDTPHSSRDLIMAGSANVDAEMERTVKMVRYYNQFPNEKLALLVPTNREADRVSMLLDRAGISHFKISGGDFFKSIDYKTFSAIFSILVNEFNSLAWTRLLYGVGVVPRLTDARELMAKLRSLMLSPFDIVAPEPRISAFCHLYQEGEFVLFDTETTGLDLFEDDIVQIAAFKVRKGARVEGSDFNIIIHTDREIPAMLGEIENPLVEEYALRPHLSHEEGLRMFLDYVGELPVMAHNAHFDSLMLQNNVQRYLGEELSLEVYDSLRLIKCVRPDMKMYKLKYLLEELHLEGENSHLADDDIAATLSLVDFCVREAVPKLRDIQKFIALPNTQRLKAKLQSVESFIVGIQSIMDIPISELNHDLADVMRGVYVSMVKMGWLREMGPKFDIFLRYVRHEWQESEQPSSLRELISRHLLDMSASLSEGDLINSIRGEFQPIFVMTVHKGKGLEFDNVIVLGAADGTYPNYRDMRAMHNAYSSAQQVRDAEQAVMESARCLYVAITRAQKRLCISYPRLNPRGYDSRLSPFLECIQHYFLQG